MNANSALRSALAFLVLNVLFSTSPANGAPSGAVVEWGGFTMPMVDPGTRFVAVAAGAVHNLALTEQGTVVAWQHNGFNQCAVAHDLRNVVAIAAGYEHSLALKSDGTVVAWGENSSSQATVPGAVRDIVAIAGGHSHSLALRRDGTVIGWGRNTDPAGFPIGQSTPPRGLSNVVAIAAGDFHSMALTADGRVVVWGYNNYGQANAPAGLSNVVAIAAGALHSLALKADGTVIAWGANESSTGGSFQSGQSRVPAGLSDVIAIAASADHSLALKADGTPVGWGNNSNGQSATPTGVDGLVSITAGALHNLGLRTNGTLVTWGGNGVGQATLPTDFNNNVTFVAAGCFSLPACLKTGGILFPLTGDFRPAVSNLVAVAPGYPNTLLLRSDGSVLIWDRGASLTRLWVTNAVAIAAGEEHYALLTSEGSVQTSGIYAQGLTNISAIAAGAYHGLGLRKDGTVVAWGPSIWSGADYGQARVPPGLSNVVAIAAGGWHSLALKSDGTVVAWGGNRDMNGRVSGQITIPPGLSNVVAIAAGGWHSLALKSDGTIAAWGGNDAGQSRAPEGLSNVIAIAAGGFYSLALVASPPCVLTCPFPVVAPNEPGLCGATVFYSPPFTTNCDQAIISCDPPSGSFFPVGTNAVTCTALSGEEASTCTFDVVVNDSEPPVIHSITARPNTLWPPNHKMRDVRIQLHATDNCRLASARITRITCNEAPSRKPKPGQAADWEITGPLSVKLRAERSGSGGDRIYAITVQCTDNTGNTSTASVHVSVPHSPAGSSLSRPLASPVPE